MTESWPTGSALSGSIADTSNLIYWLKMKRERICQKELVTSTNGFTKLAVLSTFPPTRCGLATYAADLVSALQNIRRNPTVLKMAVTGPPDNQPVADFVIERSRQNSWVSAHQWLRDEKVEALLVQHEFKIFGGPFGSNLLRLIEAHPCRIITTLHSVSRHFRGARLEVIRRVCAASDRLIVHTSDSKSVLERFGIDRQRICVIPHGVHTFSFEPIGENCGGPIRKRPIFISFGHLRKSKGYEIAIDALGGLRDNGIPFEYWIYGKNHPRPRSAAKYRADLIARVNKLGLNNRVRFIDAFLTAEELARIIKTADIGILPYTRAEQASSGTLVFCLACGRPVVASAFRAACEIIDAQCGRLFPVGNADALSSTLTQICRNESLQRQMRRAAFVKAQPWAWHLVANRYLNVLSSLEH